MLCNNGNAAGFPYHWNITTSFSTQFYFSSVVDNSMPVPDLQKSAPKFQGTAVIDGQFKEISLEDYKGKYVVLFFYPLDL